MVTMGTTKMEEMMEAGVRGDTDGDGGHASFFGKGRRGDCDGFGDGIDSGGDGLGGLVVPMKIVRVLMVTIHGDSGCVSCRREKGGNDDSHGDGVNGEGDGVVMKVQVGERGHDDERGNGGDGINGSGDGGGDSYGNDSMSLVREGG
ncbi:eggshell protein 2A-like [Phoenix dactylifera]|uniref:Eggshell protein 2A-like n=1 Tax=Phoenix dactylifera TaxID=42345 RepID=A0A8B9AD35_PHODC|nr:eggshell protein 2A-like [Phoenix dactylifera]